GIGQYIENAYEQWETPPSFVLLVGDSDNLPTNYRYQHPIQFNMTAADLWYFTVDGVDYFADMHYGRISVDNTSQLNQILTKLSSYEKTPQSGAWNNHAFLASYQEDGLYFHITSDQIYTYLNSVGYDVDRAYENGTPPGDTQDVIDNFNEGCFLVNHRDHGGREDWVHPSFWVYDFPQVNNGQKMPMVFSINCLSGYFDSETDDTQGTFESFSEQLLRKSPGGAIGLISSSRSSYSGYNDELNKGLIDAMWPGFNTGYPGSSQNPWSSTCRPGAVLNYAKWYMYDKYVLTDGAGYPDGYPWGPTPEQTRLQMEMYHCHGDPTLDVHTASPTAMVVSHDPTTPMGSAAFDVAVNVEGALVALSQSGAVIGRAFVTGGSAHIVFDEPPSQGTMDIVVTAHNRIPHESSVSIVSATGWFLSLESVEGLDIAGHVDGVIEQGDSVALTVTLRNVGSMAAPDAVGRLFTGDSRVDIAVDTQSFGTVPPGASAAGEGPFRLKVHGGVDDGQVVPFTLEVSSGDSLWLRSFSLTIHAPLLRVAQVLVDDSAGNGNGYAEPGETVDVWVSLENSGSGTATMVEASLFCGNAAATVQTALAAYPNIPPSETESPLSAFRVSFAASCPLGAIPFTQTVTCFGPDAATLAFSVVVGAVPVLVVDTDDEATEQRLLDAMDQLDHQYRLWRTYLQGTVPPDTLALYRAVVWTGGDNPNSSATSDDQEGLAQYLSSGGSLLFSAENYLSAYGGASFTANFLHVESYETNINGNWVNGIADDPVSDDFGTALDYPPGLSTTPDELTPDPEAAAILTTQPFERCVALRYPATGQGAYRVVFMAVPFEAIAQGGADPDNPETLLDQALTWLMAGADLTPPQAIGDLSLAPGAGSSAALTWQPVSDNVAVDHYAVHRGVVAHFLPTASTLVGTTTSTAWTDAAATGDPDVDHFYVVIALDAAGNQSAPSNRVGEHEKVLEP
ncbi:MAG: C25 family cysteine peptidase, partial [Candidatus Eisenbacteria bacterium]|nr:C25 family cysteine peptidase [Candidatus Eisenbacteria bacterium]